MKLESHSVCVNVSAQENLLENPLLNCAIVLREAVGYVSQSLACFGFVFLTFTF